MILCVCPNPSVDTYWFLTQIESGKVNRIIDEKEYPGGKGVHVALALAELKSNVHLHGIWGGQRGQWIKTKCETYGIETTGAFLSSENRKCISVQSQNELWHDTEFLNAGPIISDEVYLNFLNQYDKLLETSEGIVLSGSWPKTDQLMPYGAFISKAKSLNIPCWLDYAGPDLLYLLKLNPFGIHLNHHELNQIFPNYSLNEAIEFILKDVEILALTFGQEGLKLYTKFDAISASVSIDQVYSSIGSGDCLTAGLAFATVNKFSHKEMAILGVACGAANCLREDLGMLYDQDVQRLIPLVRTSNV